MTERGASFEPKGSLRDLLSDEEFREILAPFPGDGGGPEDVVLLLGGDPDDAERIAAHLLARGARVQPVADRFLALDELRSHPFRAFVAAVDSLGSDPGGYLERVREAGADLRLGFIAAADAPVPAWLGEEGTVARRPLDAVALDRLFPWAAPTEGAGGPGGGGPVPGDPPPRAATPPPSPPPPGAARPLPAPGGRAPDWLAAVRALLEARSGGTPLDEALRRWAERDPACAGWGEVRDLEGTLTLRAGGADRASLLAALSAEVAATPEPPATPLTRGAFACLPGDAGWTALWWRDADSGRAGWERLGALLPLVDALRAAGGPAPAGAAPRDRLLRVIDARMHALTRHGGSLGLLAIDPGDPAALLPVVDDLAPRLRGEDWLEIEAGRIWVVLERPDATVGPALSARLGALAAGGALRAVGARWRPGGEGAEELVARLARALAAGEGPAIDWEE